MNIPKDKAGFPFFMTFTWNEKIERQNLLDQNRNGQQTRRSKHHKTGGNTSWRPEIQHFYPTHDPQHRQNYFSTTLKNDTSTANKKFEDLSHREKLNEQVNSLF